MDDLKEHSIKWLDLNKLSKIITSPLKGPSIEILYFTAYATWKPEQYKRHRAYVAALKSVGVKVVMGNFKCKKRKCKNCSVEWESHEEKETDVNIAINIIKSAYERAYDRLFIVTGDTDVAPAIRMAKQIYAEGLITIAAPPGRDKYINALVNSADNKQKLSFEMFKQAQFPDVINDDRGNVICNKPAKYK